jgi:copper transport protein
MLPSVLTETAIGQSWIALIIITALGFMAVAIEMPVISLVWALAILVAEGLNGHVVSHDPFVMNAVFNSIHLIAAAMWAGGLTILLLFLRKHRDQTLKLLPRFSQAAFGSIILLTMTGFAIALMYLPAITDITRSDWGRWVIAKFAIVVCIALIGWWIRRRVAKAPDAVPSRIMLMDFSLMLVVVAIASILSMLNPVPPIGEPFHWHEMGDDVHMTAKVSSNLPGDNTFSLDLWLPVGKETIEKVAWTLQRQDGNSNDEEEIVVPLKEKDETSEEEFVYNFPGFNKYSFTAEGDYLDDSGSYLIRITVQTAEGLDKEYEGYIHVQ